jgi:hypothetical protein
MQLLLPAMTQGLFLMVSVQPSAPGFGSLAQLVERLPYTQNVGSSSLSRPTRHKPLTGNGAGLLFWLNMYAHQWCARCSHSGVFAVSAPKSLRSEGEPV